MARGNFGERLKRERELREVTLEEITQATRIGPRFLEALENEEWDRLPGGVFNRGFVRSIAHYLGLDEEALLAEYDLAHNTHADQQAQKQAQKIEERIPQTPLWMPVALVVGALLLVIAIIWGGIYGWRRHLRHSAPKPAAGITSPAADPAIDANGFAPLISFSASIRKTEFVASAAGSGAVLLELNPEAMPPVGAPAPPVQ
ncbi:MAG TPA: helix-turn-helix domain-containing protein [Candidatus Acidoferrum sp.]|nr:helix-turn-helix domain-containing protein [Candidatus Acidoferrum sp.]